MEAITKISHKSPLLASLLLGLALFIYTIIRAVKVGFTHDESSSFINLIHEPIKDVFFNELNWQAANNHLTNTLFMQVGHHFFGGEEWALRWGSILAGLIFLVYAFRTVNLWLSANSWWFFGAFCLFVLNHFVIDFFSLARGYGLCLGFEMATLYYFFRWIKQEEDSDLLKAGGALGLGILSNFTLLDLMAAFFVAVTIVFYVRNKNSGDDARGRDVIYNVSTWLRTILLPALPVLLALLLIIQPMRWINAKGEFEYGPQAFWETWRVLVERYVHHPYLDYIWFKAPVLIIATILFAGMGYSLVKRFRTSGINSHPALFYAALLTVLTMLVTAIQHYLLGANYLIGRTAVLFYPLLSSVAVLYLIALKNRSHTARWKWILIVALVIVNFCSQINIRFSIEWPYDENTKEAALFVNQQGDNEHKSYYGVSWIYYSTTIFYQQTLGLSNFTVKYNASHDDESWINATPFDIIYVEKKLQPKVEEKYAVIKTYSQGIVMKRK